MTASHRYIRDAEQDFPVFESTSSPSFPIWVYI